MSLEFQYTDGKPFFCLCEQDAIVLTQHETGERAKDFESAVNDLESRGSVKIGKIKLERL